MNRLRRIAPLLLILGLALALRLWGIEFGLPNTVVRPDEGRVVGEAARFTINANLDPDYFTYPSLFLYVTGLVFAAGCEGKVIVHAYPSIHACALAWYENWSPLFVTARVLSALGGVAGVAAVFAIGRRLHPWAGWLASIFLAVAFLHVRDSHFAVTDVTMTSMLLGALILTLRADARPSNGRFALAGFVTGLAASTKYNAVMLGIAVVVSQVRVWVWPAPNEPARHTRVVIFGAMTLVGFLIASPYALINSHAFIRDTSYEFWHLLNWDRVPLDIGWRYHAMLTLPNGVGWPIFLLGVAGIVWTLKTQTRTAAIVFAFPLLYYGVAGRGQSVYVRYMIPIVPFLCLGAAACLAKLGDLLTGSPRLVAVATLALVCAVPLAVKDIGLDHLLAQTDSRVLAANWIARRVPAGSTVFMSTGGVQLSDHGVQLPYKVQTWDRDALRLTGPAHERPDWIVIEESPLYHYSIVAPELKAILGEYELRHTIAAMDMSVHHVYDQQDEFYVPLDGFAGVVRPGPNISFYARR